ncbi:MAG: TIGR00645 family protein, partial [Betaproteobacteria bacterium]|nr:TIGR00645 family protein [Betaproteobacteria bacterium]
FASRWLQLPLYLGLIVAQAVYVVLFVQELSHLVPVLWDANALDNTANTLGLIAKNKEIVVMLMVLSLIDVVMISNLLIMVIIGGYETFVSRLDLEGHPDQPEWLSHVNANVLKVKLATAIIGISSIHLLKTFISAESLSDKTMLWQTVIHLAFIVSALSIAWIDRMLSGASSQAH